jgi:hypothetical protein
MGLQHTFSEDYLSDTAYDPGYADWCLAPYATTGYSTNIMSYQYAHYKMITRMQASIIRAAAYFRGN